MASPNTSTPNGFTLIEILVVLGIFVILAGMGLLMSMDMYRGNSLGSERNLIISVLQKARSQAINNISEQSHGVRIENDKYVIFEGTDCSVSGEIISANKSVSHDFIRCIKFEQLTGNSTDQNIKVYQDDKNFTVEVNSQGRISWD